jgi:5-methyltetrahydrofolate--homocysteine methyltransferase
MQKIELELLKRILILDGAMGTMIQTYDLHEQDFKGSFLKGHTVDVKGNNELLNLTRPEIIIDIHKQYLAAGADIICTNTFNGNRISQADYHTQHLVYEINYQGASLARQAVESLAETRPCFVAGAIGPTSKLASLSPDVNNPAARAISFDELVITFTEQAQALLDGGVDIFLLETVTDTLNAKAALFALMQLFDKIGKQVPIMVSGTITDASGRILSGQTLEAFLISISHAPLLSVGLNCALGAKELRPYIQELAKLSPFPISTHPNAGLPNEFGEYEQSPEQIAMLLEEFAQEGWVNIVGGCCGTTPAHIRAIAKAMKSYAPRLHYQSRGLSSSVKKRVNETNYSAGYKELKVNYTLASKPTNSLKDLMDLISQAEDEPTYNQIKTHFDQQKNLYHPEQALLINAHLFGRFQYLKTEGKLAKIH